MFGWFSQKIMPLCGPSEKIAPFFSLKLRFSDRAECGNTDRISVIRNLTDRHYAVGRLQGRPQASAEGQHEEDVGGAGHEHGQHGGAGHGGVIERKKRSARKRLKLELFRAR